ncbi:ribonuclease H-like domain-containing protein [Tanacetum coccineum]
MKPLIGTKKLIAEPVTYVMMALTGVEQDNWSMEFDAEHVHFGQDGLGDFDWSNKDNDTPVSLALMATNSEVPYCSKCSNPEEDLKDYAINDSVCSGSRQETRTFRSDFKEFKRWFIWLLEMTLKVENHRKRNIKTSCLDFGESLAMWKSSSYNSLISVSQSVTRSTIAPRKKMSTTWNTKKHYSSGGITCLVAKATEDEAVLWHRRLGHVNFKNISKLVKGNLEEPHERVERSQALAYETVGRKRVQEELLQFNYKTSRFEDPAHPNKVLSKLQALYGLHQAPRAGIMLMISSLELPRSSMVKDFEDLMQKEFNMHSMCELSHFSLSLGFKSSPKSNGCVSAQGTPKVSHHTAVKRILSVSQQNQRTLFGLMVIRRAVGAFSFACFLNKQLEGVGQTSRLLYHPFHFLPRSSHALARTRNIVLSHSRLASSQDAQGSQRKVLLILRASACFSTRKGDENEELNIEEKKPSSNVKWRHKRIGFETTQSTANKFEHDPGPPTYSTSQPTQRIKYETSGRIKKKGKIKDGGFMNRRSAYLR